jgi:hypothetical protein
MIVAGSCHAVAERLSKVAGSFLKTVAGQLPTPPGNCCQVVVFVSNNHV